MTYCLSASARRFMAACSFGVLLASPTVSGATTLNATQSLGSYQFSLSDAFGSGNFGTVTISTVSGSTVDIAVSVSPNYLLDTGAHEVFTFSLVAGASIVPGSLTGSGVSHFTIQGPVASVGNPPFGNFTWDMTSNCTQGNCGPTNGQSFDFQVQNFAGIKSATSQYNNEDVFFAADIYKGGCTGDGCTGVVGATFLSVTNHQGGETPLPAAVWLMGTILGGGAGVGAWRRRRQKTNIA